MYHLPKSEGLDCKVEKAGMYNVNFYLSNNLKQTYLVSVGLNIIGLYIEPKTNFKNNYFVNESFDISTVDVHPIYEDDSVNEKILLESDKLKIEPNKFTNNGVIPIKISLISDNNVNNTIQVAVSPAIRKLEINPNYEKFSEGIPFGASLYDTKYIEWEIKALYTDGTEKDIDYKQCDIQYNNPNSIVLGKENKVLVTALGFTEEVNINVISKKIEKTYFITKNTKPILNNTFKLDFDVVLFYTNGTEQRINGGVCTI